MASHRLAVVWVADAPSFEFASLWVPADEYGDPGDVRVGSEREAVHRQGPAVPRHLVAHVTRTRVSDGLGPRALCGRREDGRGNP